MQTTARVLAKTTLVVTAVWVMGLERSCFETSARFGNASELMELQMRRICKGFPCSSPLQAVNFCVKFAKSGVKRVIGQVVAVLENSKIPGQAEVVPALAAAGIRYFRALPVEVILFGIRARSADNFCFISLVGGFIPGQFEPLPGGFLRFRKRVEMFRSVRSSKHPISILYRSASVLQRSVPFRVLLPGMPSMAP